VANYNVVKKAVIGVVDDFTKLAITANYGPKVPGKYNAKTKLERIGINAPVLSIMPMRLNKVMDALSTNWKDVGTLDLVQQVTIGHMILLACAQSQTKVPAGEPT
jgi:hypothetical protein